MKDSFEQIWPIDATHLLVPLQAKQPDQGHAIRGHHPGIVKDPPESRITLTIHDAVGGRHTYVCWLAILDPTINSLRRQAQINGADADPKDIDSRVHSKALPVCLEGHLGGRPSGIRSQKAPFPRSTARGVRSRIRMSNHRE